MSIADHLFFACLQWFAVADEAFRCGDMVTHKEARFWHAISAASYRVAAGSRLPA